MPTPEDEKKADKLAKSGLASNRVKAKEMQGAEPSVTTANRAKSMAASKATAAKDQAAMAASPVGQFQQRMKSGYDPFEGVPAQATGNAPMSVSVDESVDLLGNPKQTDFSASMNDRFANTGDPFEDQRQRQITDVANKGLHSEGAQFVDVGPAKRIGLGRQDEQRLAALGPEYLSEANKLAKSDVSTPAPMRATINGQEFIGQPGQRVGRDALGILAQRVAMERLKREGIDAEGRKFGQEQTLARIPGQNAVDLARTKGDYALQGQESQQAFQAPERDARVAESGQKIAASQGQEARTQRTFDETMDPANKQRAAADDLAKQLVDSGMAATPEGQALMALIAGKGTASRLGPEVADPFAKIAGKPNPAAQLQTVQEFTADPQVARLLQSIQSNKPGFFASPERSQKQAADRKALDAYIARYAAAKGVDPQELKMQIESQLVGTNGTSPGNLALGQTAKAMIPGVGLFAR